MDLGSIFLILGLLVLVGLFVARPLFEPRKTESNPEAASTAGQELSSLLAERDRVLNALQELDFDFAVGKIPAEDYPSQRAVLLKSGADVLRSLDEMQADQRQQATERQLAITAEERLEAAISARRLAPERAAVTAGNGGAAADAAAEAEDDIEVMLAQRRRACSEKSGGFCPQCGGPVQKSDRFCPKCGKKL